MTHKPVVLIVLVSFLLWHPGYCQDPFFTHFYGNASEFNPAMTGSNGALSLTGKYKSQWGNQQLKAFQSGLLTVEESLPCSLFDYGFALKFDEEGDGSFRTYDTGFKFAGTVAFEPGGRQSDALLNLRMGAALRFAWKTIDYSKLVFSDQLDPKYGLYDADGNLNPTGFSAPNDGRSNTFFAPGVGLALNFISDLNSSRPLRAALGVAYHNLYPIGSTANGNEDSILGIGTTLPDRLSVFAELEFIPWYENGRFFTARPLFLYQQQGTDDPLSYYEAGLSLGLNQSLQVGALYHSSQSPEEGQNTNWYTFNIEFGGIISNRKTRDRVDLGFAYSNNFTGLRNSVGPILEVTVSYHLASSPSCNLMGRGDEVDYANNGMACPTASFSNRRKKIYENIWYKNK